MTRLWKGCNILPDGSELGGSNSDQWIPSSLWIGIVSVIISAASLVVTRGELGVEIGRGTLGIHFVDDWIEESEGGLSSVESVLVKESDKTGNERSGSRSATNKLASTRSLQETDLFTNSANIGEGTVGAIEEGARRKSNTTGEVSVNSISLVGRHSRELREAAASIEASGVAAQSGLLVEASRAVAVVAGLRTDWW